MSARKTGDLGVVIKEAYEVQKLNVDEIASAFGLDAALVRTVLAAKSRDYRTQAVLDGNGEKVYEIVSDDDFSRVASAYKDMLLDPESGAPHAVRERGLRWLMNEKLGRNKVESKTPAGVTFNILRVNERIQGLSARREKLLEAIVESTAGTATPDSQAPPAASPNPVAE